MKNKLNIALVGLGQVGNYLMNELNLKKKDIELKTGKKINLVAISAKNINKKRKFKINKKIFYSNPLDILKIKNLDIVIEAIGLSDGISKKIIETALKNKIHVINHAGAFLIVSRKQGHVLQVIELEPKKLQCPHEAFNRNSKRLLSIEELECLSHLERRRSHVRTLEELVLHHAF